METPHTQKPTICHSTLSSSSSSHDICLSKAAATKDVEYGGTVNLVCSYVLIIERLALQSLYLEKCYLVWSYHIDFVKVAIQIIMRMFNRGQD